RTCEPRPLAQDGQIRPARRWVPQNLGPGRQIVSKDSRSGVSRIGGQAGTQATDPTPASPQNRASRAGSTIHSLPAESVCPLIAGSVRDIKRRPASSVRVIRAVFISSGKLVLPREPFRESNEARPGQAFSRLA